MHRATPFYASASDIPVVIVMIHWPTGASVKPLYDRVVQAQRSIAQNDPRATFIDTGDLKSNYHLNAGGLFVVSYLIV
jgi:hypothetical protein